MDIQEAREAFERRQAKALNVPYEGLKARFDENSRLFGARYNAGSINEKEWNLWLEAWQAKAQAVPEGFVLVEKSKVRTWYQDDDEPENFCNSESDLDCLGDCLDDDDIIAVNIHESAHISTRKVFGVWKSNSPTDIQSKFILVDSHEEAEKIVASNKAMIEAQEPTND